MKAKNADHYNLQNLCTDLRKNIQPKCDKPLKCSFLNSKIVFALNNATTKVCLQRFGSWDTNHHY